MEMQCQKAHSALKRVKFSGIISCTWTEWAFGLQCPKGVRVRRYEYWQLTELTALFPYLSQDLHSEQSQNKIPNDLDIKPVVLCVLLSPVLLSPKEMLNCCHEVFLR